MSSDIYISIDYGHLVRLGQVYSKYVDLAPATISNRIVGHARLFERASKNKGCTAHTYRDVIKWFVQNWPDDLEWPADVPRPMPVPPQKLGDDA